MWCRRTLAFLLFLALLFSPYRLSPDQQTGKVTQHIQFDAYDVNEFEYKLNMWVLHWTIFVGSLKLLAERYMCTIVYKCILWTGFSVGSSFFLFLILMWQNLCFQGHWNVHKENQVASSREQEGKLYTLFCLSAYNIVNLRLTNGNFTSLLLCCCVHPRLIYCCVTVTMAYQLVLWIHGSSACFVSSQHQLFYSSWLTCLFLSVHGSPICYCHFVAY